MRGHFAEDLSGQVFGYNLVLHRAPNYYRPSDVEQNFPRAVWTCKCLICGNIKDIRASHLKSGRVISCGCLGQKHAKEAKIKHGKSKTKLYQVWLNIKNRCYNKNVKCYKNYGGRGIYMCDEWKEDYQSFYDWCVKNGYNEKAEFMQCQIDRIDNNGPYAPWNCRFVTAKENANNRRKAELRDKTLYTVYSISATRFEWQTIINTSEYRIKYRAQQWNIPIEKFILYVIERNAGLIKTKAGKEFDKELFIKNLIKIAEDNKLPDMNNQEFRCFIANHLKGKNNDD